jgi:hypothetical protein
LDKNNWMIYLAIDTCSWLILISEKEINPQIELLTFWVAENIIKILVPDIVKAEWTEKKSEIRDKHHKEWNAKQRAFVEVEKKINKSSNSIPNYPLIDLNFIDQQIELIERLIFGSECQISASNDLIIFIHIIINRYQK